MVWSAPELEVDPAVVAGSVAVPIGLPKGPVVGIPGGFVIAELGTL